MKTTIEFLDELKAKHGGISDYAIAPMLGVTRGAVSKYRVGKDYLGDATAIRVAELLEIDPAIIIAAYTLPAPSAYAVSIESSAQCILCKIIRRKKTSTFGSFLSFF